MADHVLESRMTIGRPRAEVFAFLADPHTLPRLTPPSARVHVLGATQPLAAGAVIDLRLRWLGLPLRWRQFVREYDPPYRFLDVQLRGPWGRWEHRHQFLERPEGTLVEERLAYRLPFGVAGRAVHGLLVRRQLAAACAYRRRRLHELLGPVSWPAA